ncbi:hypothetical protein SAMN06265365_107177 [Tistlia consotensis]|uniref:Uncharacterized protein n=1 Tax=Tistlia consotensis USBA 355 TaxID=560819 RepID=A0A1Y6B9U3_9PROT|nr:hypothetical protein [Tistlia consotensis]SME98520.1 hypothetical protein SAMN05428998_102179 [Tistlia consotensis USBA 355]SNR57900.1 hypothetical protein SAMN06265365_107177 [Tistlia consotensis]
MALVKLSPGERLLRVVKRTVWRLRKLLDPSLAGSLRRYAERQYEQLQRLNFARENLVTLRRLLGGRYLLRFPTRLTNNEKSAFLTLQEAEIVTPRICRLVVRDAFAEPAAETEGGPVPERPILVGPWTTEIGFEILYWIPFLRYFARRRGVPPGRLIAISRGGAQSWYDGVCDGYLDLFDLMSVEEFVERTTAQEAQAGGKKGFGVLPTDFEMEIYRRAAEKLGLEDYAFLSPSVMYTMFRNIWRGRYSADRLMKHIDIQPIPTRYPRPALPFEGPYVALKFYHSSCFAEGAETDAFLQRLVEGLSANHKVVLLNTGTKLDDHSDAMGEGHSNVFDASQLYGPRDNLAVQTALVANASALHCTYGGFAYLGPLLKVPTTCYFTKPNFVGTHLDLAIRHLDPERGLLGVQPISAPLALGPAADPAS